jgi:hypothetical protein
MFCCVVAVVVFGLLLGETVFRILHFRPISPCFQQLHAALSGSLVRLPSPAAFPGSLAEKLQT